MSSYSESVDTTIEQGVPFDAIGDTPANALESTKSPSAEISASSSLNRESLRDIHDYLDYLKVERGLARNTISS